MRPHRKKCRNCGRALPRDVRSDAKFCGSSCRAEAARERKAARSTQGRFEAGRHAHKRSDTAYAVFKAKTLDSDGAGLTDFELVGFARVRVKSRAVEALGSEEPEAQFVAVPMKSLDLYYGDGRRVKSLPHSQLPQY